MTGDWRLYKGGVYRCMVYLTAEDKGNFSVVAATLPGVASQGDTQEEALANISEALQAAVGVYKEDEAAVPSSPTPIEGGLEKQDTRRCTTPS